MVLTASIISGMCSVALGAMSGGRMLSLRMSSSYEEMYLLAMTSQGSSVSLDLSMMWSSTSV